MTIKVLRYCVVVFLTLLLTNSIQAQTILNGKVVEKSFGNALAGASVIIKGTTIGGVTNIDGNFSIRSARPLPWTLVVSYTGYNSLEITVNDANEILRIRLDESNSVLKEVIVSASRRPEKAQDAPAAVSLLNSKAFSTASVAIDPVKELSNVPGVQIQQQSAARMNIEMRGAAGLFDTQVFPILDYRSLVGPGIGTFQSDASGLNSIDLQRIGNSSWTCVSVVWTRGSFWCHPFHVKKPDRCTRHYCRIDRRNNEYFWGVCSSCFPLKRQKIWFQSKCSL
jgi:outer membrane receptor for ferrienterochelin and colicins